MLKKTILLLSLSLSFILNSHLLSAQTYILLDRRWYKPAELTDSITRANLSDGWYPIFKNELDTLITLVEKFKDLKKDGFERKFYFADDYKTQHIIFEIENIKRAYGDGYDINLISTTNVGKVTLKLSEQGKRLMANQDNVRAFLSYLKLTKKNIDNPKKGKKKSGSNPLTG